MFATMLSSLSTKKDTNTPKPTINDSQNTYLIRTGKQLAAGALSSWCEAAITYPTEYVKVMLQVQGKGTERQFTGAFDVVRQTFHSHGSLGMYRGFSVVLMGNVRKYMCRFGAYEQLKLLFVDSSGYLSPFNRILCGFGAGVVEALFAVIPTESVKVKFIHDRCSDKPKYGGLFHGVREIIRERGFGAMYTGVTATILKQGSNQAIRFAVFESLQDWNATQNDSGTPNKALIPVFGAIAGATSVFCNTPLDVIKSRMQGLEAQQYKSTADCMMQVYRREGVFAFYKGVTPRLVKVCLKVAIAFTMYNTFLDLLGANR